MAAGKGIALWLDLVTGEVSTHARLPARVVAVDLQQDVAILRRESNVGSGFDLEMHNLPGVLCSHLPAG